MALILIVDDDKDIRAIFRKALERSGFEVAEAKNGEEGVRLFFEKPADLIITDLLMPVMPGTRLISKLKSDFPNLKIIAVSGGGNLYQSGDYLALAKELGAMCILEKPISLSELIRAVEDVLSKPG